MRLKQLKLAGFKSFVEPTWIPFPSHLVAVVGPNGCGKSNVIDAVRWVMGESSAKNLRGESMADVIFNGSSNRKSLGQASVELVFDNSLGRLGGPFTAFQEVAIKRLITRDGDSSYFLNGTRCRRRDINDIFLGTGAGARGYAIIGQNMIARIIDARPEDLRAYLEEAAGVSKYKDRRRETLQRITHTRENLTRVADVRDELDKQLIRLEKQAKAAQQYKALKEEERQARIEIMAFKYQALHQEKDVISREHRRLSLVFEQQQSRSAALQKEHASAQESLHESNKIHQEIQAAYHQAGNEVARMEAVIQQRQQEKKHLLDDIAEVKNDYDKAVQQLNQDKAELQKNQSTLSEFELHLKELRTVYETKYTRFQTIQTQVTALQKKWQVLLANHNQAKNEKKVIALQAQHLEEKRQQIMQRLEAIANERSTHVSQALEEELAALEVKEENLNLEYRQAQDHVQQKNHSLNALRQQLTEAEKHLRSQQKTVQTLTTEQAALKAMQDAALKSAKEENAFPKGAHHSRLVELLEVEKKWFHACELVLGESLQGIVLDSMAELIENLPQDKTCSAVLVSRSNGQSQPGPYPKLRDKMQGFIPNWLIQLEHVFAAESLAEALSWLPDLNSNQSVVTADGYWLGLGWAKVGKLSKENEQGLLARKHQLVKLSTHLQEQAVVLQSLEEAIETLHARFQEESTLAEEYKEILSEKREAHQACQLTIAQKKPALEQIIRRSRSLESEQEALQEQLESLIEDKLNKQEKLKQWMDKEGELAEQFALLNKDKEYHEQNHSNLQAQIEAAREQHHQAERSYDKKVQNSQLVTERIAQEILRIEALNDRLKLLNERVYGLENPDEELQQSLVKSLSEYQCLHERMNQKRQEMDDRRLQITGIEQALKQVEKQSGDVQEKIQQLTLEEQALSIRAQSVTEALTELNADLKTVLKKLPHEEALAQREQALALVVEKLKRLGAINLVAIEEHQTELERRQHLDDQYHDLCQALTMLESAIAKMDKETEARFKDTFDAVNELFQSLFPRLFGGGRAKLELTCDNLLEAGVQVLAQPPGKRNSTIHLLSGGEKAMTAVALVFAIFQLNPAPFCMLDEVDAPLDDANVRRFCELVRELSQDVQFLFITHNKVTMELAEQLIGVTMKEPGVSRIVAVDIEDALSFVT